jgi:hypothetical protein
VTVYAAELGAARPVLSGMASFTPRRASRRMPPWHVRPALLAALALSLLLHLGWSMWPVAFVAAPEQPPLTVTLTQMPPPPVPVQPTPPVPTPRPPSAVERAPTPKIVRKRTPSRVEHAPVIAAPGSTEEVAPAQIASTPPSIAQAPATRAPAPDVVIGPPAAPEIPPVVLPPRLDLAYKVYFGTQGFMIGDATYRFEHDGDRYRISTVGEPRGLAALIVHGKGLVESRGTITPQGLKPYEFAIERGSADKREVAYFDWDAGNVVLNGGDIATLEAPAFDPLTILWQPYFSPPSGDDQTFSLATTRRVARYTLSLQGEETIAWRHGDVLTQRWHEKSDDGKTEGWFWLAPSMHYIPVKMRVTRTSRGTLEALLDAIRTDDASGATDADRQPADDNTPIKPPDPRAPDPGGAESHGQ